MLCGTREVKTIATHPYFTPDAYQKIGRECGVISSIHFLKSVEPGIYTSHILGLYTSYTKCFLHENEISCKT